MEKEFHKDTFSIASSYPLDYPIIFGPVFFSR